MCSYRPEELFTDEGGLRREIADLAPEGTRRLTANPKTNGGLVRRDLRMPDFRHYAVEVPAPGATRSEATREAGKLLRDVIRLNPESFRVFGPRDRGSGRRADPRSCAGPMSRACVPCANGRACRRRTAILLT